MQRNGSCGCMPVNEVECKRKTNVNYTSYKRWLAFYVLYSNIFELESYLFHNFPSVVIHHLVFNLNKKFESG